MEVSLNTGGCSNVGITYTSVCPPACLSVRLPVCLSVCLPVCLSACLPIGLPACLSACLREIINDCLINKRAHLLILQIYDSGIAVADQYSSFKLRNGDCGPKKSCASPLLINTENGTANFRLRRKYRFLGRQIWILLTQIS
jgi:hypothetical protein